MSDPAVEAAQRAWVDRDAAEIDLYRHQPVLSMRDGSIAGCQCMDRVFYRDTEDWGSHLAEVCNGLLETAAREMAKPIRELHKPREWEWHNEPRVSCTCGLHPWPCPTARLIYPTEELQR